MDRRQPPSLHPKPITFEASREDVEVEGAVQYDDQYSENTFTFVNNINTHEGGTHLTGFKSALTRTINEWAKQDGALKKEDFTLSATTSAKAQLRAQRQSQKPAVRRADQDQAGQLGSRRHRQDGRQRRLGAFFDKNPSVARSIIAKGGERGRPARRPARRASWCAKERPRRRLLPGNSRLLAHRPKLCEIYLVEGDSAAARRRWGATAATRRSCRCAAKS